MAYEGSANHVQLMQPARGATENWTELQRKFRIGGLDVRGQKFTLLRYCKKKKKKRKVSSIVSSNHCSDFKRFPAQMFLFEKSRTFEA
jgi:hypothetical protein